MKPPWLEIAEGELGVSEIPGPRNNPRIIEYHDETTLSANDEDTSWCSSFVNWCITQAGIQGTNSAWARSWLEWGREPENGDEWKGCVCILSRGETSGHVGFLEDWDATRVKLLGGNQGDSVNYTWFPMNRVLGYRVPA